MIVSRLKYLWFYLVMRITWVLPDWQPFMRLRGWLVGPSFKRRGKNFQLASTVMIVNSANIAIGDNVYFADGVWLQGVGGIDISDEVMLGPQTVIATNNHQICKGSFRFAKGQSAPVTIGFGSWTGAGVRITSGVEIGRSVLCAAGSVVTKNIPDGVVVGGVPAEIISNIQSGCLDNS